MMSWNEDCDSFDSRVEASAKDANFNDTVFLLTQDDAEDPAGDKISANKSILALISPVFYAQFYGPLSNNQPPPIEDGTARGFKQLIRFICNPISFKLPEDNVVEVFEISYFARKYQIGPLVSKCRQMLGRFNVEGKELEILNWAISTEQGLELKETLTPEYELLVNWCYTQIEENFEKIFPNGLIKDGQELLDENLMVKILGKKELHTDETFVLLVALDYYRKLIENGQKSVKDEKRLKMDSEAVWNETLVKIRSVIMFNKVSPKKFAELFEKVIDTVPNKIICDITKSISSSWKDREVSEDAGKRHRSDWDVIIDFDCKSSEWDHDDDLMINDQVLTSGAQITFKTNQNAILHFHTVSMLGMKCWKSRCHNDEVDCCVQDRIILKNEGNFKDEIILTRIKNNPDCEYRFYVEANKIMTLRYERNCKRLSCPLHLERMEKFNFSQDNFDVEILEVNGQPVTSPSYSFLTFLGFTPL